MEFQFVCPTFLSPKEPRQDERNWKFLLTTWEINWMKINWMMCFLVHAFQRPLFGLSHRFPHKTQTISCLKSTWWKLMLLHINLDDKFYPQILAKSKFNFTKIFHRFFSKTNFFFPFSAEMKKFETSPNVGSELNFNWKSL